MHGNINSKVNALLKTVRKDSTHTLQTQIHPSVNFKRNSVNLLIGKRGSGKTYNVFREILKLLYVKDHKYSQFVYITDKATDQTFNDIKHLMPIPYDKVTYDDAAAFLKRICMSKDDISWLHEQGITDVHQLSDESKEEVLDTLKINTIDPIVHTLVLFDDCIQIFTKQTKENKELFRMLFENRQPKITYFLCLQDPIGINTQIKQNIDSLWFFGGFNRMKFSQMFQQISTDVDKEDLWQAYIRLNKRNAIIFSFDNSGTKINILKD